MHKYSFGILVIVFGLVVSGCGDGGSGSGSPPTPTAQSSTDPTLTVPVQTALANSAAVGTDTPATVSGSSENSSVVNPSPPIPITGSGPLTFGPAMTGTFNGGPFGGITPIQSTSAGTGITTAASSTSPLRSASNSPPGKSKDEEIVTGLIVKHRAQASAEIAQLEASDASGLSKHAKVPLSVLRRMSGGAHVLKMEQRVTLSEARVIAARLMHNDSSIEYAEPDLRVHPLFTPTDPDYATYQWSFFAPAGANKGGANLPLAWDLTRGSSSVVVAVIDNGYRQHIDFAPLLPGYDFITDPTLSNDGNGRDTDAQDPSDSVVADECYPGSPPRTGHWHGTAMVGYIAGLVNNGRYGTGVAPGVKILPARVIGKCGGLTSDVVDGMRWAAGLSVPGVPSNPNRANILSISIGAEASCNALGAFQSAVTEIVNAGKVIVVAAGNGQLNPGLEAPANCNGVIAVTAHAIDGDLAQYANVSPQVALSAPGGGCGKLAFQSTCFTESDPNGLGTYGYTNTGLTSPGADSFRLGEGSSGSAAEVAGVAALLLSVKPTLTPAQVRSILQSSARPFPAGTWCTTAAATGLCGAGLLDANAALRLTPIPPAVTITNTAQVVAPNVTVVLSGTATADAGRSINSYSWTQLTGASVGTIANSNTPNASFTAPATGTYSFQLTAIDSGGSTGTANTTVRVNSPPVLTAVGSQTVAAGANLNFIVGATDVDGDTPIFVSVSLPPGASLSPTGAFSWPATTAGSYTLTYFARDNDANSPNGTVNISIVSADPTVPTVPSTLVGSVLTGTQLSLSWPASTDAAGVTGYQLERCQGVGCTNFALIASPTTTSYVDNSVTPGVSYSYRVRAQDTAGKFSAYSPVTTQIPANQRTLASDTFVRADENPLAHGVWSFGYGSFSNCAIAGNAVINPRPSADCLASYSSGVWPNNQWSQITIGTFSSSLNEMVAVRVQPTPTGSYYACMIRRGASFTSGIRIYTNQSSSPTFATSSAETWQPGDVARCQVQNDSNGYPVIRLFKNGTPVTSYTDTSNTYRSGFPGLAIQSSTQTISAWSGGDFASTPVAPPTQVTGVQVGTTTNTTAVISHSGASSSIGIAGYRYELCVGAGCSNFGLWSTTGPQLSTTLTGLTANTTYTGRVNATDTSGTQGPYSSTFTFTTTNVTTPTRRTLASDNFVRANENPLSGGGTWASGYSGFFNCQLASNAVSNTGVGQGDCLAAYTAGSWPNDQWSQITIGTFSSSLNEMVAVRAQPTPTSSYYACMIRQGSSFSAGFRIYTNGVSGSTLAATTAATWQPGDLALCQVQNDSNGHPVISLFRNGTLVTSYTDLSNTYMSGRPGLAIQSASQTVGPWSGGDFGGTPPPPPPPPPTRRTLASDNFVRANENPLSGGGTWASGYAGGFVNCKLASNAVANTVVGGGDCLAAYTAGSWPNNQWSQITVGTFSSTLGEMVAVRVQPTPMSSFYACMIRQGSSFSAGFRIYTNGVSGSTLAATTAATWQSGDLALCQVQNDSNGHPVISLFKNGTLVTSYTDPSNTYMSGLPGLAIQSASQTVGPWSGGDFQ